MKKRILNIGIPLALLVTAVFIIGPACTGEPDDYRYNWWPDLDQDGFGDSSATPIMATNTNAPANHVRDNTDCDDSNDIIYPGATEVPDNLIDEDCNGKIAFTFYTDKDEDGFGNPNSAVVIEIEDYNNDAPNGYSWYAGDCDDDNAAINPLADEIAENGIDDNCDGEIDIVEYYIDADGDGYGSNQLAAAQG
ncbi:MAG: putative metal-binding motif-containing protein, partial [Lutibacter sp.]